MKKLLIFITVALFLNISCKKIIFGEDEASKSPIKNFDYLWEEVDKKYSFFELKGIDWQEIRTRYREKIYSGMTEDSMFRVLGAMLNELRDDHTNLVSPFNIQIYNVELRHKPNFNSRTIQEFYTNKDPYYTGSFYHSFLNDGQIGYIRYSSFMNAVSEDDLDFVLTRYKDTKGLVLDLRSNGGGMIVVIPQILSRFVDKRTLVAYSRTRNGENHSDFSDYQEYYLNPSDNVLYTEKPVMVLTDRGSYSATTMFSLLTKALPNVTLVGDTTGGGGGLPNGGQLPNGWTYRFSISQISDLNKNIYAEDGVPPDIYAEFDWNDLSKDEILDRAVEEILKEDLKYSK